MSHDALRRLGVFSVGDRCVFTPSDWANDEQYVVVLCLADDESPCPQAALGHLQVQVEDEAWADGRPIIKWVKPSSLRHRSDLLGKP